MTGLPKGLYAGPDGKQRFWDGEAWYELPEVSESSPEVPESPKVRTGIGTWSRKRKLIVAGTALAVIVALGVASSVVLQQQAVAAAAAEEEARQVELAKAEAEAAAEAAAAAEQADIEQRQQNRREAVTEIEASIEAMAVDHIKDGIITGKVISTSCTTTGGVPLDDIKVRSMLFECFVATKDNGDGTLSGFKYHARANWDTGSWTYGIGGE